VGGGGVVVLWVEVFGGVGGRGGGWGFVAGGLLGGGVFVLSAF